MTEKLNLLLKEQKRLLLKALGHLELSYNKVLKLSSNVETLTADQLEVWESFTSRFSRSSDLFVNKFLRTTLLLQDPAYKGTLIDSLNSAEKLGLISKSSTWYRIRELRNIEAHEYTESDLSNFIAELRLLAPEILAVKNRLESL